MEKDVMTIANRALERQIAMPIGGQLKTVAVRNRLTDQSVTMDPDEFRLVIGETTLTSREFKIRSIDVDQPANRWVAITLMGQGLEVRVTYQVDPEANFMTKQLRITNFLLETNINA